MAKGKHSTALFEVFHNARKPDRVVQRLRTPKWWFKGSKSASSADTSAEPTAQTVEEPPRQPKWQPRWQPAQPEAPAPAPVASPSDSESDRSSAVDFDGRRKEVTFRLRYTTALVSGFGVCVVIAMAYIIGRHMTRGPQSALAEQPSIQQLMQQPPQPNVLKVTKPRPQGATSDQRKSSASNQNTVRQAASNSLVPAAAYTELPRKPHLQYAIIGIYPNQERAKAEAARDFFNTHGIPCTLEKTGWAPTWISLVGTAGFSSSSSADWKIYTANILKAAEGIKSSFDKLPPIAYGWRGDETAYR